jgi:uncharacterized cupredoxin-like copper-binding protein
MTRTQARVGIGAGLVALAVVLVFAASTLAGPRPSSTVEIVVKFSKFQPDQVVVPVGVPVTIILRNDDPIDHEWIVGDEAVHAVHRVGTEPLHPDRPTEVILPAMVSTTTVVTFEQAGTLQFICHLPGHESYGMKGTLTIR